MIRQPLFRTGGMTMKEDMVWTLPAVALRGLTILPDMVAHFDISRKQSIQAVETAMSGGEKIFLITQKDAEKEDPGLDDLYEIGVIAEVKEVVKMPGGIVRVLIEGIERATLRTLEERDGYMQAEVVCFAEEAEIPSQEVQEAMRRSLQDTLKTFCATIPKLKKEMADQLSEHQELGGFMDQVANMLPIYYTYKQKVLEAATVEERYEVLMGILFNEINIMEIKTELQNKLKDRMEKNQKEYIMREQMKLIREELGEDDTDSDVDTFFEQLRKLKASKEVKDKIKKEITRFKRTAGNTAESTVLRGYIETLLELPWDKKTKDRHDLKQAEEILNRDHYGLEQVKERILEFLAVRSLAQKGQSPIICLVGPPGTGKTSIARSVAEALQKKYVRISLGGVRDEAEIRGHRRTYVGAMPGRIVTGLKSAGVKNPLMLLDEIDKVGSDYKGDPAAALLEVLDAEQNNKFRDHYIEIPVDLSEVLFIATANDAQDIPRPLYDRMEIIEVSSYTANEKLHIAQEHLFAKQLEKNGLEEKQLSISKAAMERIIQNYTREAGVRNLERKIGEICRKTARAIYTGEKKKVKVTESNLERYLGKPRYFYEKANEKDEVGIVRGLAWTSVGGDTLEIEVNLVPGKGEQVLTGQMGDVMRESAQIAYSYVRSVGKKYGVEQKVFEKNDLHLHIPEGAVPKDGPSAGVTMATAILSAFTNRKVRADVAMTGEITLRGRVLPIGGLKEKLLAANKAGIKLVCVPKANERDVEEIAAEIKRGMEICFVEHMDEVIEHAFVKKKEEKN